MKKIILAMSMVFFLGACSDDNNSGGPGLNGKDKGKGDGGTQSDVFQVPQKKSQDLALNSILGTWESQTFTVSEIKIKIRIQITPTKFTAASQCIYPDGVILYAQATSRATYSDEVITTYDEDEEVATFQQNGKSYSCRASVEKDTFEMNIFNGKIQAGDFVLTKVAN